MQRRHQKLIEETPSRLVDDDLRARIADAATSLVREANYVNAGTIECMLDEDGSFYFLEMNTRLQVEHTVTEMVTGWTSSRCRSRSPSAGASLGLEVAPRGHAIECRINAEDPAAQLPARPRPDHTATRSPAGRSCAWTPASPRAATIPGDYDSMFAKLIVAGADREQARSPDAPRAR